MKILINLENTQQFDEVSVEPTDTIESLKYIIEACFSIPYNEIQLVFYNTNQILNLPDTTLINKTPLENDCMIVVRKGKAQPPINSNLNISNSTNSNLNFNSINDLLKQNKQNNNPSNSQAKPDLGSIFDNTMKMLENTKDSGLRIKAQNEAKQIYNQCMVDPGELSILFNTDSELAEAIASENLKQTEDIIFNRLKNYYDKQEKERKEYDRLLLGDSNDPEAQKKIEAYIHKEKIRENKQLAMEYFPESFFSTHHMLYIPLEINKYKVIALVDTGAQMTIMSIDIAYKCGLYNLIDHDFQGQAVGVGTSKIIGVVHCAQIKIQDRYLMAKITVIENVSIGFIFGLDNMRSHRCTIELASNKLIFPDAELNVPFLSDGEAKKLKEVHAEENAELIKTQSENEKKGKESKKEDENKK